MGNAMRCEAMRGEGEPQSLWPSHSCRRVSGQPKWPIGRYLRCFTRSAVAATTLLQMPAESQLLDEWCIYASYVSYKYIFEICIWLPMWMRLCECAGNPICGCECYANKWNECELRNDATYLQWITHRVSVVNKTIWCCVCTWRMLNIWTRAQKKNK